MVVRVNLMSNWRIQLVTRRTTVLTIIGLVLLWGFSWSAIKYGLDYSPPILYAGIRTLTGGLVLLLPNLIRRKELQLRRNLRVYLISSLFNVVLFFGLQTVGLYFLPSGLLSVLVYLQPILVGFLAWLWLGESLSTAKVFGLILGFLGVATVSLESLAGKTSLTGILIAISAGLFWAIGTVYLKRVQGQVDMLWLVSIQFIVGGLVLLASGSTVESWSSIQWNWPYFGSMFYSSVFGVSVSWVMWLKLVHAGEVSRVSSYIFTVPLLSVVIGTLLLHESFSLFLFLGLLFIVVGIYLANRPQRTKPTHPMETCDGSLQ